MANSPCSCRRRSKAMPIVDVASTLGEALGIRGISNFYGPRHHQSKNAPNLAVENLSSKGEDFQPSTDKLKGLPQVANRLDPFTCVSYSPQPHYTALAAKSTHPRGRIHATFSQTSP